MPRRLALTAARNRHHPAPMRQPRLGAVNASTWLARASSSSYIWSRVFWNVNTLLVYRVYSGEALARLGPKPHSSSSRILMTFPTMLASASMPSSAATMFFSIVRFVRMITST